MERGGNANMQWGRVGGDLSSERGCGGAQVPEQTGSRDAMGYAQEVKRSRCLASHFHNHRQGDS